MLALVQYHFLVLYTLTPQFSRIIVFLLTQNAFGYIVLSAIVSMLIVSMLAC